MRFKSPIFRRFLWIAFLPAAFTLAAADFYLRWSAVPRGAERGWNHPLTLPMLLLALLVALVAAWLGSAEFLMRIRRLSAFAENLVHSRLPATNPLPDQEDELGSLARALSRAAAQWQELLDRLQLESGRREAILKSMAEGVLAVDDRLRVIFCNESFARLVSSTLPLPPWLPLHDLARDPGLTEMLNQVIASRQPVRQTIQLTAADSRVFEVQAAPLAESQGFGAIAILHDITDLERLERVRKDFVANVSHELRTPLTAIRGYAETLLDGAIDDAAQSRKFIEVILAHALRLNNIASDLLTLSDLESGRPHPESQRVSILSAVETALRTIEPEARLRGVTLVRGDMEDAAILGSKVRLEQALINLLDNAVKFNHPGGHARVEAGTTSSDQALISVSDDGVGIPSEDLSRVFERFYRVDKARSREVGGTGLGLSIVKHIIERMNGSVKVESQLGKGSTFTLVFPRAPVHPQA